MINEHWRAYSLYRIQPEFSHGLANFDGWIERCIGKAMTMISAVGPTAAPMFTAVMEVQDTAMGNGSYDWDWNADLGSAGLERLDSEAVNTSQILTCITSYGNGTEEPQYAGIWQPNIYWDYTQWAFIDGTVANDWQGTYDQYTSLPGWRPYFISVMPNLSLVSIWGDSYIGDDWVAVVNLTSDQYQAAFNQYTAQSLYPINVQASGLGSNAIYTAIFGTADVPLSRSFSVDHSFNATSAEPASSIRSTMSDFMFNNSIRSAQLAIYNHGTLYLSNAYDDSEPGKRPTSASDLFMLAGLSEMYCAAAINKLLNSDTLHFNDTAYSKLNWHGALDPRADDITIQQLLDHTSGYGPLIDNRQDPIFHMRDIAQELDQTVPVTKVDVASWVYSHCTLDTAPGSTYQDFDYNYLLLSLIIEQVTGTDYLTYLEQNIIPTASNVTVYQTLATPRPANAIIPEDVGMGQSAVNLTETALVPAVYGGDGLIKEVGAGCCGLAGSASDIALFISENAVQGIGGRASGRSRVSSLAGGLAYAESRADGVDWAFVVNTRDWSGGDGVAPQNDFVRIIDGILDSAQL